MEIDLSHVTEVYGAGLQFMVTLKLESQARDTKLSFVGHNTSVREVLDLCNLCGPFGDPVFIH